MKQELRIKLDSMSREVQNIADGLHCKIHYNTGRLADLRLLIDSAQRILKNIDEELLNSKDPI